ncbi:MAG: hypothetical protein J7K15_13595 [Deltaproteobacteria bacterium]|nr:hypothetical protein [Deltaproteobacteria bacterium]
MRQLKRVFLLLICMGIISFLPNLVRAAVNGPCVNCHIMHNSQNGGDVDAGGPYGHLTKGNCIGCHTGTNSGGGTSTGTIPYVYSTTEPEYGTTTLAGGNFYWVADNGGNNDTKGHNVLGLSGQDQEILDSEGAPGVWANCAESCHMTLAAEQTVYPELGSGCEGCHLAVKHHKSGSTTEGIADEEDGWFRFCSGHMSGGGHGVEGIEDDDWQYETASDNHNEYLGNAVNATTTAGFYNLGNTMTAYCCGCHGGFHVQDDSGSWIRHPSDAIIPDSGEYAAYTTYSPEAPVARPSLTTVSSTVTPGTDMVMCLSCHRAHGSPYDDMLRWDYDGQVAGGGGDDGTGCFTCHTTKDD